MSDTAGKPTLSVDARKGALMVAAALAVVTILAAAPFYWQARLSAEVQAQKAERDLLAARAQKSARMQGVRLIREDKVERMFLPAGTDGMAQAAFQHVVREAASRAGMSVLRLQPLEAAPDGPLAIHLLAVDAQGSIEQLRAFLTGLESVLPVIIVAGIEVRPRSPEAAAEASYPSESLAVSLRLEAHGWRSAP